MSDFDEEAERERLREKYERDQERREAAQHMSDLLLKGATMTNAHCGECGSPIFRNQGEEFCPTCDEPRDVSGDGAAQQGAAGAQQGGAGAQQAGAAQGAGEDASQSGDASADSTDESGEPEVEPVDDLGAGDASAGRSRANAAAGDEQASQQPRQSQHPQRPQQPQRSQQPANAGSAGGQRPRSDAGGHSLAAAQQELLAAVTEHARAAREADPRDAREHLEAASEAADALATLSQ